MNDPIIRMQGIEIYSTLIEYRFVPQGRRYVNRNVVLFDTLTQKECSVENLEILVMGEAGVTGCARPNQLIVHSTHKISNKKERHEISGHSGTLLLNGRRYQIKNVFVRTQLLKSVPERHVIPLLPI